MNENIENVDNEKKHYQYLVLQRNKKYLQYGIIMTLIGLSVFLMKELILNYVNYKFSISLVIFGTISFVLGIGLLLYRYLQTGLLEILLHSLILIIL